MKKIILLGIVAIFALQILALASAFTITSVSTNPTQITPGATARVNIEIKNNLNDDFENIKVSLNLQNLPFSPYQSSSEVFIDEVREGKSEDIEFQVQADSSAAAGVYKIPVNIFYNGTTETSYISLTVNGKPQLELNSESYLIKGKNNEITIKIINSGLVDSRFLSMNLENSALKLISSSYVYIGDIDSNDFDTVSFNVYASKTISGLLTIPVTISYRDPLNNQYTEVKQITLQAYSEKEAANLGLITVSNTGTIVLVIVILIILYLIYRFIRKKLRNRKKKGE